jgi:hypothetical protein
VDIDIDRYEHGHQIIVTFSDVDSVQFGYGLGTSVLKQMSLFELMSYLAGIAEKLEKEDRGNNKNLSGKKYHKYITEGHKNLIEKIDQSREEVKAAIIICNADIENNFSNVSLSDLKKKVLKCK